MWLVHKRDLSQAKQCVRKVGLDDDDRISIYKIFPNDTDDISYKYEVLDLFMTLLKCLPDLDNSEQLLKLLTENDVLESETSKETKL